MPTRHARAWNGTQMLWPQSSSSTELCALGRLPLLVTLATVSTWTALRGPPEAADPFHCPPGSLQQQFLSHTESQPGHHGYDVIREGAAGSLSPTRSRAQCRQAVLIVLDS
mmetsp:Transcript_31524/g.89510  ORF Transcript_31524/g.89510 Transcript_31524/m.89510 type:complete len:111 (+) Transcript_31524:527-859(+)